MGTGWYPRDVPACGLAAGTSEWSQNNLAKMSGGRRKSILPTVRIFWGRRGGSQTPGVRGRGRAGARGARSSAAAPVSSSPVASRYRA
jgi:hypothetical protein